jgi:hypothetical protein
MKAELAVFVRIALYIIAGRVTAGGWLPADLQPELVSPAVIEAVTGLIIAGGTVLWYRVSQARAALLKALT